MSAPAVHTQPPQGATNGRWLKVGLLLLVTYLVAYIDRTNMSIAAPSMSDDLGLNSARMGVLLSAFFWGYVVSLAFAGLVVTKLGAKRSIVISLFVFGLASAATGLTEHFGQLIAVRVLLGLGEGLVFPAITIFFVKWFPSWERGRASGLSLLAIPVSAIVMAPLGGWLISNWGYKTMFVVQGLPPIVIALVVLLVLAADPAKDRRINAAERAYIVDNRDRDEARPTGVLRDVYLSPRVWLTGLTYLLWVTGLYGFNQWLPTLLSEASGSGIEAVGWLTTIPFVFAAVAMVLVSRASDRTTGTRTPYVVIPIALAGAALLLQHIVGGGLWVQVFFLVIAGIGVHAAFGPWWPWALEDVPNAQTGFASSLILSIGNLGGIIGPMLVGFLTGGGSVSDGGFYTLGYVLLVGAALGLVISAWRRRAYATATPPTAGSSTPGIGHATAKDHS